MDRKLSLRNPKVIQAGRDKAGTTTPGLQISRLCLIYHMTRHHTGSGKYGERAVDLGTITSHKSYNIYGQEDEDC